MAHVTAKRQFQTKRKLPFISYRTIPVAVMLNCSFTHHVLFRWFCRASSSGAWRVALQSSEEVHCGQLFFLHPRLHLAHGRLKCVLLGVTEDGARMTEI